MKQIKSIEAIKDIPNASCEDVNHDCSKCPSVCRICGECLTGEDGYKVSITYAEMFYLCEYCGERLEKCLTSMEKLRRRAKQTKFQSTLSSKSTVKNVFGGNSDN